MQFEQYFPDDLWTPSSDDGTVQQTYSNLTSLDFYLLDDIDTYLAPVESKTSKNDLIQDSLNDNSQHQEDLFPDFDIECLNDLDERSDFLSDFISTEGIDITELISQTYFPLTPTDASDSPLLTTEDGSSIQTSITDEVIPSIDMVVPPSPSLLSTASSPVSTRKKPKLTVTERKLRKKTQNKSAAEKYRLKKKSEQHVLLDKHSHLKKKNTELRLELENLTYRVEQFKKLFSDFVQTQTPISS